MVCFLKHGEKEPKMDHVEKGDEALSSVLVSQKTGSHKGAENPDCILSIVPVKVKSKKGN